MFKDWNTALQSHPAPNNIQYNHGFKLNRAFQDHQVCSKCISEWCSCDAVEHWGTLRLSTLGWPGMSLVACSALNLWQATKLLFTATCQSILTSKHKRIPFLSPSPQPGKKFCLSTLAQMSMSPSVFTRGYKVSNTYKCKEIWYSLQLWIAHPHKPIEFKQNRVWGA